MCLLRIYTYCVNASTKYRKVPVIKGSILAIEDNFSALFKDKFEHQSIIFITTEIKFSFAFYITEIILTFPLYQDQIFLIFLKRRPKNLDFLGLDFLESIIMKFLS